ncbi:glycosyl transferase family 1 [Bryobacterales bacterium F-183]|nr:glycosyl transferase family 1 [Bryobacterales bacterium F-183]
MINRVALLLTQLATDGGAEAQVSSLAREFQRMRWDVHVISIRPPRSTLEDAGIPLHSLDMHSALDLPAAIVRLRRLIRDIRPDVLHSHMTHANLLARITRPLLQVPVVINTLHGLRMYNMQGEGYMLREAAHRLTDRLADLTTVVCNEANSYYVQAKAVSPGRILTMPNGVDVDRFRPDAALRFATRLALDLDREFTWICAARFHSVKNHPALLRAFHATLQNRPDSVLLLVGEGPGQAELHALSKELGIQSKVRFLGRRNDLPALLNASDAFALASRFEALSIALLEAAACGLPIACTDVGGNRDIVIDGYNGFLAKADASDLDAAMRRIAGLSFAARSAFSTNARMHVQRNFELHGVAQSWCDLYLKLATGAAAHA